MAEDTLLARRACEEALAGWVTAACLAYAVVFAVLRLATVPAIFYDDALEALRGQGWGLAYVSSQPPLYTWMVRAAAIALSNAPLAHVAVKYACFAIAGVCIFQAARATIADVRLAAFATGSLLLVWDFGVEAHRQLTQTVLLLAFIAGTWTIVAQILRDGASTARAVALGLVIAGGALTKYSYFIYAGALAVALALDSSARSRFADRRMWLAALVATALIVPHLVAMQGLARVSAALFVGDASGPIARRLIAVWRLASIVVVASLPMPIVWAAFFPAAFRRAPPGTQPPSLDEALLARWCLATLGVFAFGAVAFGTFNLRPHYVEPLAVPLAILFFARLARLGPTPVAVRRFAWAILAAAILGAIAVTAWLEVESRRCSGCPPLRDYAAAAQALTRAGAADALIVGTDFQAVGNLLALLPAARGWAIETDPPDAIPADARGRSCALVWGSTVGAAAAAPVPDWARALVRTPPGLAEVQNVASPIRGPFGRSSRLYWLSFAIVPPAACVLPRG
jgi:hypothetical protein